MSERVPLDLNELRPKPYPSGPSIARQKAKQKERIAQLRALGIKASPGGWLSAITIGAGDADKVISALKKAKQQSVSGVVNT